MGRELFDYAFKEYARRWAFKHPEPADFFRTMEDASAEDLDWFWRGWFYSTDATDISLDSVKYARAEPGTNSPAMRDTFRMQALPKPVLPGYDDISKIRNRQDASIKFQTDADTSLRDFYWRYDRGLEPVDTARYRIPQNAMLEKMDDATAAKMGSKHFYELSFSNKGGLVMPIIVEWTFEDGTKEIDRIPAQVWRLNEGKVTKFFMKDKRVTGIKLDPNRETADIDETNNTWGNPIPEPSRFQVFKQKQGPGRGQSTGVNPMQKAQEKKGF
jgi:hypothetical protein